MPVPPIPGRDLPTSTGSTATRRAPRKPPSRARRRLNRVVFALLALLGVVVAAYGGLYVYGDQALARVDALVPDGPEVLAPQLQVGSESSLVVTSGLPGRSGVASVSALVTHVAEDGRTVVVTLPPTALTDTPACRAADGSLRAPATEPLADALLQGGPSCLVRSVQQLTGLRVDHYVGVDAARLPGLVDVLGEVDVCPTPGEQRMAGAAVADHLRPGGAGSDVTGAVVGARGQQVLGSTLTAGLSGGALADPLTLARFLSRTGDTLTVDAETSLEDVRSLGLALGPAGERAVEVTALPVAQVGRVATGSDQAAVVVDAQATRVLFDEVINSGRLPAPEAPAEGQPAPADAAAVSAGPVVVDPVPAGTTVTVAPAGVTVDVLDATGTGRTAEVADGLAAGGFRIGARGVEPGAVDRTVVRYGAAALEPARTVAAAVPGALLLQTEQVGAAVQLVVGPDFVGLAPTDIGAPVPTTAAPPPAEAGDGAGACTS